MVNDAATPLCSFGERLGVWLRRLFVAGRCLSRFDRHSHGFTIEYREGPRQTQTNRTGIGVGRSPELCAAGTKDLALGQELSVNFKADDGFEFHGASLPA